MGFLFENNLWAPNEPIIHKSYLLSNRSLVKKSMLLFKNIAFCFGITYMNAFVTHSFLFLAIKITSLTCRFGHSGWIKERAIMDFNGNLLFHGLLVWPLVSSNSDIVRYRYTASLKCCLLNNQGLYYLRRESSWRSLSNVIWLILDLDAQYFDIWDTFHDNDWSDRYKELYISCMLMKVHFKEDHIRQATGHFLSP